MFLAGWPFRSAACRATVRDVEADGVRERTGTLAARLLAMVVPLGMLLVALVQSSLIAHGGVHLCRWPATISCDRGVPLMWPILSAAGWLLACVATVDWALFATRGRRDSGSRLFAWLVWGPYVALCTVLAIEGRAIDGVDLALGMTVVVSALLIVAAAITGWTGIPQRWALMLLSPLIAAALLVPLWAPAAFRAAARAEDRERSRPDGVIELDDSHISPPDRPLP